MIAPGAMMIAGSPDGDELVKISVVGPVTNIFLFFQPSLFCFQHSISRKPDTGGMLFFAAYINAFMAVFNLLPVGILDGFKIFTFNKKVWILAFIPAVLLAVTNLPADLNRHPFSLALKSL